MIVKKSLEVDASEVHEEGARGTTIRWLISDKDGAPTFSMRLFEVEPGGHTPLHSHPWEHEVYVIKGQAIVVGGDEEKRITQGDVVFIPPNEVHQFSNPSGEKVCFLCLIPNPPR